MPVDKDDPRPNVLALDCDYLTDDVHTDTYPAIDPSKNNLKGKVVFITGASRGIGQALAISYARAGVAGVVIGARSDLSKVEKAAFQAAEEAHRAAPKVLKVKLNVTSVESVGQAVAEIEKTFGRLDIVINNAGVFGGGTIADSNPDDWWNIWEINIRGVYLVSRAVIPLLLKSEGGDKTIVNVSSCGAHLILPGTSAHQTGKLAVLRLGEFLQAEYGSQGLLAYAIHPGNSPTGILGSIGGTPKGLEHGKSCSIALM